MKNTKLLVLLIVSGVIFAALLIGAYAVFLVPGGEKPADSAGQVHIRQENLGIETSYKSDNFGEKVEQWDPGDVNKLRWEVRNLGGRSAATRNTILLYWDVPVGEDIREYDHTDADGNPKPGTLYIYPTVHPDGAPYTQEQVQADMLAGAADALCKTDTTLIDTSAGGRLGYTYTALGGVLAGFDAESNTGETGTDKLAYWIAFHPRAPVTLMGREFILTVITEARPYSGSGDDEWTVVSSETIGYFKVISD
ncbi:MAG: hypothetical protein FWE80_06285 [Oscillospiraceae bacterium]|nr:hypothetical protein [Oscillospiraceae bacterium]